MKRILLLAITVTIAVTSSSCILFRKREPKPVAIPVSAFVEQPKTPADPTKITINIYNGPTNQRRDEDRLP